jgi:hypothetical protein
LPATSFGAGIDVLSQPRSELHAGRTDAPHSILRTRIHIDLHVVDENEARVRLLTSVAPGRLKPAGPPTFPGSRS